MLRVAVDGLNLAADRRGMGRYARVVLDALAAEEEIDVTVIIKERSHLRSESDDSFERYAIVTLDEAPRRRFDATWYPWNGMRFRLEGPNVATIHDVFAFRYPHPNLIARRREQRPIRRAVKEATVLTTVSQSSAREIAEEFAVPLDLLTIASPVPSDFWKPASAPQRPPYFLFIAAPDARKNAAMLFRAFARAFPNRDVQLVVAGTLSDADERLLREINIAYDRVTPTDEQLRELYTGAISLLIPSLDEGYGLPAVEAMACGAAVIAADRGGLPEACDGAALLLPADDVQQWQAAVTAVTHDFNRRQDLRSQSLARAARIDRTLPGKIIVERLRQAAATAR